MAVWLEKAMLLKQRTARLRALPVLGLLLYPPALEAAALTHTSQVDFSSGTYVGWGADIGNEGNVMLSQEGTDLQSGFTASPSNLPEIREGHEMVAWRGKLYVVGGQYNDGGSNGARKSVYYAAINPDGSVGSWVAAPDLLIHRLTYGMAIWNGKLYISGGQTLAVTTAGVNYATINPDGSVDSWTATTPLPLNILGHSMAAWNGRLYVFGGKEGAGPPHAGVYYAPINADGSVGSWTTSPDSLPTPEVGLAGSVWNGKLYALGGCNMGCYSIVQSSVYYTTIDANGALESWGILTNMPAASTYHALNIWGGKIYFSGGYNGVAQSSMYYVPIDSDGSLGTWTATAYPMPASRWLHAMAFWDGRVYISGGRDGSDVATTTLWYSTLGVTLNYSSIGAYYSPLVDLGSAQVLESISWNASLPSGSSLSVSIATATQGSEPLASWTQVANGAPILTSARYLNYRVDMARGSDPAQTPVLQDITISYLPSLSLIPSNLRAAPLEGRKIKLDWDPSASTYTASYNIYYDSGTGAVNYADLLSSVSHPTTSYVTNPLTAGVTYRFGIRAQDLLGLEEKNTSVQASAAALETLSSGQVKAAIGVPQSGRRISGNLILVTAEIAQGNPSQVKEVAFQYRLASSTSSSWTNILAVNVNDPNPDLSPPYCIHWDATGLSSADYELRATAKDLSGSPDSYPSSIVITVDHASPEIEEKKVGSSLEKKELVFNAIGQTIEMADNCRTATTKIFLPSGLLNNSSATIKVVANPAGVPSPPEKTLEAGGQALDIGLANGQSQLNQPAAITLGYADSNNDGLVDGTLARADKLAIYSYNTTASRWQKEAQSAIDSAKKTVTAQTMHFSFFGLFAPAASDLSNALVYPVPYVPNDGNSDNGKPFNPADSNSGILFDNLTGAVKIQIYTVSGELVWEKVTDNSSGKVQWDAKNSSGQDVASGGYIALLTDTSSGHKVVKKLAVVR